MVSFLAVKKRSMKSILRVALIYAIFSTLWIVFSDRAVAAIVRDPKRLTQYQTLKGMAFISLSTLLIFLLMYREFKAREKIEETLERGKRFASAILDTAGALVIVMDAGGKILYTNRVVAALTGYSFDELRDCILWDKLFPEEESASFSVFYEALKKQKSALYKEANIKMKEGGNRRIAWSNTIIRKADGSVEYVICTGVDISARKEAEEHALRRLRYLDALHDVDLAITSSLDINHTLSILLDTVILHLKIDATDVLLLNQVTLDLAHNADRGFNVTPVKRQQRRLGEGFAGRSALERKMIYIKDLQDEPNTHPDAELFRKEQFVTYIAFPLVAKGKIKGVLEIFHRKVLEPDPEWLNFLESLANQASIALDNTDMFDALQRSHVDLKLAYDTTLEGWARALELRDKETEGHTRRVAEMSVSLGRLMGLPEEDLTYLWYGALLHDIGKMGIPDDILLKNGPLTGEEWEIMRKHPTYAYEMLSPIPFLRPAIDIPYCHQERWDGSGYPRGLKEDHIPLPARIFSVVDIWDALRSERPYHKALSEGEARKEMRALSGVKLDPQIVNIFLNKILNPVT